ncbi:hypothetical protein SAMN05444064_11281 [Pseudomonas syringae]|nr:hypothetical protein SAMN05444514_11181 [Pseudomonas syringae]SFM26431.1 hypothetical protein SAMN05444064_11281 [Pseudomonas syringae]
MLNLAAIEQATQNLLCLTDYLRFSLFKQPNGSHDQ